MNKLLIDNISVKYENDSEYVLENFSLEIRDKELLVILGSSGCGKSTLLKSISGLITPEKGTIIFNNKCYFDSSKSFNTPTEKRNMGYCFQNHALCPHMNVYNNLAFPLKVKKCKKARIRAKVQEMLDFIDMARYDSQFPNMLSGGEQQRVALGRALIYDPKLLLLDEPLANLDANLKHDLAKGIKDIHNEFNLTTIYVTHDQLEAFELADRIAIMQKGKIIQIGTPKEIYDYPKNRFVAKFIGKNNILKLDENLQKLLKIDSIEPYISIRPNDITLSKVSGIKTKITNIKYLGNTYEITLDYRGQTIIISIDNIDNYAISDSIYFKINKWVLVDK